MHRREVIKLLGIAPCLMSLPAAAAAGPRQPPRWKTAVGLNGFASSSWKYKKTFPIWEVLDFASRQGFDGVELTQNWPMGDYPPGEDARRVAAMKRLYDAFGLQVFSLQTTARDAFAPEEAARKQWLEQFRSRARLVQALGGSCIGLWPAGPLRGQSVEEAIRLLGRSFREAARLAADMGLVTAFEIEPPFAFHSEQHMQQILEAAGDPLVKVIYDPSHFDWISGSTGRPHEMLHRIGVDRIGYVQLTDSDGTLRDGGTTKHLACGDGHIDIPASLGMLLKGSFSGWIMIDAWEIPDPYDACVKGKQAIDRALATAR
jgi:sugar phosphate isomerase/epimerase